MWGLVSQHLANKSFEGVDELRVAVCAAWDEVDRSIVQELVASFPRRCQAVIEAEGGHTKY